MVRDKERRRKARDDAEWWCAQLPKRLRDARLAAGLTPYRLEMRTGISRSTIGRIERGEENPTMLRLAQLCSGIGISMLKLLRGRGRQRSE